MLTTVFMTEEVQIVKFEALAEVMMKVQVYWDV